LTPAGPLKHWSDGEIVRAIRNGVDPDGHWLTMMSYTNAGKLSDDDTEAVIAYIRSVARRRRANPGSAGSAQSGGCGDAGCWHGAERQARS
jgi:hypothetical protein